MSVDVPDSSADVRGGSHMSLAVSSEHAPAEGLFAEGAVDSPDIRAPSTRATQMTSWMRASHL
jgi:hypothetical protein